MRLLIAMMKHETKHLLAGADVPLARFGHRPGPLYGEAADSAYRGTGTGLGAYLDLAAREGAEIVLPVAAGAAPSGPVEDAAYREITDCICNAAAKGGYDGILLDLHGAAWSPKASRTARGSCCSNDCARSNPVTPIATSALDMHANLYDEIVANATVLAGYRTYPHIDTYQTARKRARSCCGQSAARCAPVIAWGNRPMLPHVMRQGSDDHPNRELQHRCAAMSAEGALCASLLYRLPACRYRQCRALGGGADRRRSRARRAAARRASRPRLGRARGLCLPDRAIGAVGRPLPGDAAAAAGRRPGRFARSLRQLRLGPDHGHDRRLGRDPAPRPRRRRRFYDPRSASGRAGDRTGIGALEWR